MLTYREIIEAGEAGDKELNVKLTARQLAALELIVDVALTQGIGSIALFAAADGFGADFGRRMQVEFARAQARLGIELNRVLGHDELRLACVARLAELDQEAAEL